MKPMQPRKRSYRISIPNTYLGPFEPNAMILEDLFQWRWSTEEEEFFSCLSGQFEVFALRPTN